jgi:hypothetical protein
VGILYVVDGIFAVLPDGEPQIKLQVRVRFGAERKPAGVGGDLVQKGR